MGQVASQQDGSVDVLTPQCSPAVLKPIIGQPANCGDKLSVTGVFFFFTFCSFLFFFILNLCLESLFVCQGQQHATAALC